MGVFWEYTDEPSPYVVKSFKEALESASPAGAEALEREAGERAKAVTGSTGKGRLHAGRLAGALAIVVVLVGVAIAAEALGLDESSKALFGLATTAFGIVVGLLTGERGK